MCDMCNGASLDELVQRVHRGVTSSGVALMSVEDVVPWAYTIGLARLGHPELVVAGLGAPLAAEVLNRLARRVIAGERFAPGNVLEEEGALFGIAAVHRSRLAAGLCAMWSQYNRVHPMGRLRALQVELPREWLCTCCRSRQPRLDRPGGVPGTPRREARRRAQPRRRRVSGPPR